MDNFIKPLNLPEEMYEKFAKDIEAHMERRRGGECREMLNDYTPSCPNDCKAKKETMYEDDFLLSVACLSCNRLIAYEKNHNWRYSYSPLNKGDEDSFFLE